MKLRSQFQTDHCRVISTNTSITSLLSASPNSSAMPSEVFSSRIAMHRRAHQTFYEVGGDMLQHLETLKSAFNELSMHSSPMTDLQKFDALIISLPHEMEHSKAMYCAWAEADQTFENVAEDLRDCYERSLLEDRQHQPYGDMSHEPHLNKSSRSKSQSRSKHRLQTNDSHDNCICMVHGSSFSWDEPDRTHFSKPLKNHENLSLIDAEESSLLETFASFSGFTALNRNVERPLQPKFEGASTQAVNRPIEPVMYHGKLLLKPKFESVSKQAPNAPIEQMRFSSNDVISRKCPSLKKKTQLLASAVFKIPNKEQGFRRKKFYSSFLCSDRAQRSRHFKPLNEPTLALTVFQTNSASSYHENKMGAGVKKISFANVAKIPSNVPAAECAVDTNTLKRHVVSAKSNKLKVVASKPTSHAAISNIAELLPPASNTEAIAANHDLTNRHLPTNKSFEPNKSSLRHKIPRKSYGPKKQPEQFAFVIVKIPNNERGYRRKKTFSSSLCSNRARRKRRLRC